MKRFIVAFILLVLAFGICLADEIGYLWRFTPPMIISPVANTQYARNASITYAWKVSAHILPDSVAYFVLQFANAANNTLNVFNPQPSGGTCDWDAPRIVYGYSYTTSHQCDHEPIYWRVQTVYKDGRTSNWAVSYHLVGDFADLAPPPRILAPHWVQYFPCAPMVHHEWTPVDGASCYEVAFSSAPKNTLYLFDNCQYDHIRTFTGTSCDLKHDCIHMPIYFLLRAVFPDGTRTNWAISYYFMVSGCKPCGDFIDTPVAADETSWGSIKSLYR
ncbi:MAG: hypothetical protein C4574_03815 [Candidatus Latescibacterota bacterium]|nr:MAG: hypothetical protein C4574_03815 [Candidatus Latescibacterota bacterium]